MDFIYLKILQWAVSWSAPIELQSLKTAAPEQVARAVAARYQLGNFFTKLLDMALKRQLPLAVKEAFIANKREEEGESEQYPGPSHEEGRRRLITALGFDYLVWRINTDPLTLQVLNFFQAAIGEFNPLIGAGAIAASEALVIPEFKQMLSALRKQHPQLAQEDLQHLTSHIAHDGDHTNEALTAIAKSVRNPFDLWAVLTGIRRYKKSITQFWRQVNPL